MTKFTIQMKRFSTILILGIMLAVGVSKADAYRTIQSERLTASAHVTEWESRSFTPPQRLYVHVYRLHSGKREPSTERFIGRCAAHHIVGGIVVRVAQRSVRGSGCNQQTRQTIRLRYVSVTDHQRFLVRVTTNPYG
jgi:hypothetical protein